MPSVWAPSTSSGYASTSLYADACNARSPTCGPLPCDSTSWCSPATGANAVAAVRMLARWFSAVIGSPRFNSALPPSATRTRIVSAPERCDENRLDGVEAILGLIEHDAGRRLEHLAGDLEAR